MGSGSPSPSSRRKPGSSQASANEEWIFVWMPTFVGMTGLGKYPAQSATSLSGAGRDKKLLHRRNGVALLPKQGDDARWTGEMQRANGNERVAPFE